MTESAKTQALEAELTRLREALALKESEQGVAPNDMGVAGRVAISRMRDTDFPEIVAAIADIPVIYRNSGHLAALAYCRGHMRTLIDAIIFSEARTGDLVQARHRLHMMLSEGEAEVMMRSDRVGARARMELLEVIERHAFAPSVKAAFARGVETPAGILPTNPGR